MFKTKLNRIIIFLALINIGLLTLWFVFLFLINREKTALADLRQQALLTGASAKSGGLSDNKASQITGYFLTGNSTIDFLEQIEQAGRQARIKLTVGQAQEQAGSLTLQLVAEGDFSAVMKFLDVLENLPYAVRVEQLELKRGEDQWRGNFTLAILQN